MSDHPPVTVILKKQKIGLLFSIGFTACFIIVCIAIDNWPGKVTQVSIVLSSGYTRTATSLSPTLQYTSTYPEIISSAIKTALPSTTPTPDPFTPYSIDYLIKRSYGGGDITIEQVLEVNNDFTRTLISYLSDGLRIYGFMDAPSRISTSTPVIIVVHGYVDKSSYETLDYSTRYADALARAGFLVLHPNLRGYPPSDNGDNFFRVGMAIDVLNLAAIVREQAGKPGPLLNADAQRIGLWGHSMGGGIVIRAITVNPGFRAALLYASASSDERQNYELIYENTSDDAGNKNELDAPEKAFLRISPLYYLDRIRAAVSIHYGSLDTDVPPAWSQDLCDLLKANGKSVECFAYQDQEHIFIGISDELFIQRTIDFFNRYLQ